MKHTANDPGRTTGRDALTRRRVLAAGAGIAVTPALVACGSDGQGSGTAPASGTTLTRTSEVPVGGGVIVEGAVVTQPEEGDFRAFSSTCTHQACTVSSVSDGTISCRCHGSAFSIADGSVEDGPATEPLPEIDVTVEGGEVIRA